MTDTDFFTLCAAVALLAVAAYCLFEEEPLLSDYGSVYVFTCNRCGKENSSAVKECHCWNCKVPTRLIWPAEDYKGKKAK